jgi:hypothetical protein
MAEPELFVPFPDSMQTAPLATAVRSTTIVMSRKGIKERGYFDEYRKHLSAEAEATLAQSVAGVWLPIDLGAEHYLACDALKLGPIEQRELGGLAMRHFRNTLMGTMARNLGSAGFISLWDVLRRYHAFYESSFQGGGTRVWKVGPKDAILEVHGLPLARISYLRQAYLGLLGEGAKFFLTTSLVAEVPRLCTERTLGFRVSWV